MKNGNKHGVKYVLYACTGRTGRLGRTMTSTDRRHRRAALNALTQTLKSRVTRRQTLPSPPSFLPVMSAAVFVPARYAGQYQTVWPVWLGIRHESHLRNFFLPLLPNPSFTP